MEISVNQSFWTLGIGNALIDASIECARKAKYVQLELTVVENNLRAIGLYTKKDFIEYGRNPKGFSSRYLGYQPIILMFKELE